MYKNNISALIVLSVLIPAMEFISSSSGDDSFEIRSLTFVESLVPKSTLRVGLTNWISTLTAVFLVIRNENDEEAKQYLRAFVPQISKLVRHLNLSIQNVDLSVTPNPSDLMILKSYAQLIAENVYLHLNSLEDPSDLIEVYIQLFDRLNLFLSNETATKFWFPFPRL